MGANLISKNNITISELLNMKSKLEKLTVEKVPFYSKVKTKKRV